MVEKRPLSIEETNLALKRKRTRDKILKILAKVFIFVMLVLVYAPLVYISVYSFTSSKVMGTWGGFSTDTYASLFSGKGDGAELLAAARNTVIVAVSSAVISVLLGTLGAIGIYYSRKKLWKNSLEFINQIPIVNAEIVTAFSLMVFFISILHMQMSLFTLIVGHVILSLPYVVLSVLPKLEQMDPSLYEAAMDLGATQTRALFKVVIPDIMPGILSGFLLSITLSLDDYVITAFTKPANILVLGEEEPFQTISTFIDDAIKRNSVPIQIRSFTAIMFGLILLVMFGMYIKSVVDAKKEKKLLKEGVK